MRENNYDLLLAIYAGGITKSCSKYIKPGGIIISNNHHNDALAALQGEDIRLEAVIRRNGRKYQVEDKAGGLLLKTLQGHNASLSTMRNSNSGMEYVDKEYYFVLKRI